MKFIKQDFILICSIACLLIVGGCRTTQSSVKPSARQETRKEEGTAIQAVLGAVSGQEVNEQGLHDLVREVQKDQEAQSAVKAIAESSSPGIDAMVCPNDGKRYSARLKTCPDGVTPLQSIKE